jgi:hypothetical protein
MNYIQNNVLNVIYKLKEEQMNFIKTELFY